MNPKNMEYIKNFNDFNVCKNMCTPDIYTQVQQWGDRDVILYFCEGGSLQIHIMKPPVPKHGFNITTIISSVWVDMNQRKSGLASNLMKLAEEKLKEMGFNEVYLEWDKLDSPEWVLNWYLKHGYVGVYNEDNYVLMKKDI